MVKNISTKIRKDWSQIKHASFVTIKNGGSLNCVLIFRILRVDWRLQLISTSFQFRINIYIKNELI